MNKILTISVAAYNVQWCLEETLKSMLVEEVLPYIEVIIVNDGSSDGTLAIAEKYHKEYPDTFLVINKENGGHGSTINASIKKASGRYFKIIDGDDWVNQIDFPKFITLLERCDADIVATKYVECYTKTGIEEIIEKNIFGDEKEHPIDTLLMQRRFAMHEIAVKTELLKKCNITVAEKCFYVDAEFMVYSLTNAETVLESELCIYRYRLGEAGQSVSPQNRAKRIRDQKIVLNNMLKYYKNNFMNFSECKKAFVTRELVAMIRYIIDSSCYESGKSIRTIKDEIMELIYHTQDDFVNYHIDMNQTTIVSLGSQSVRGKVLSVCLFQSLKHKGIGLSLYIRWIRMRACLTA